MPKLRVLVSVCAGLLLAAPAAHGATTLNIIPHGESEPAVPWASAPGILPADTQARMYDRITSLFRTVGPAQLVPSADGSGYYKSAALVARNDPSLVTTENVSGTVPGGTTVSATIRRDRYGVPHIYSATDAGALFAAGWVCATDRKLLLDQARFNGVAGLIDLPGAPAISLVLGLYDYRPSARVVREATALQTKNILATGAKGAKLLRDIDVYLAGINANYAKTSPASPSFTRTDIYALNAIKGQFLGEGGGSEIANAEFLDGLRHRLGRVKGSGAWADLKGRNDPESTTTTSRRAPWQTGTSVLRPRGAVALRNGSFSSVGVTLPGASAAAASAAVRGPHQKASNILIVSGKRSQSGAPLFVGGPQIGFNYPGLTFEEQIDSPHIHIRGSTSAPFPGYTLIGRGRGAAWSLTSAGADIIDTYAERLCGGSRHKYLFRGRCRTMERVDAGTITKDKKTVRAIFYRSVHGSLVGYARVPGSNRLVALTQRRSSYGRDTVDQLFNQALTYDGDVHDAKSFIRAAQLTPQTFNSFYASARESAFYTSGRLPLRPRGVNPDLPTDGSGSYEWAGFLAASKHPQEMNPKSGLIVNWNNKPARDFPASDDRWSENSIQRADLLLGELNRHGKLRLDQVLDAANAAATEDVRIDRFWPTLKRVLDRGRAPSARAAAEARVLQAWYRAGGSRVDADRNGFIDQPGAAILDQAWNQIASAGLCDHLGRGLCAQLEGRNGRFDQPPGGQYGGWHQYMWKDLRAQLGDRVRGRYSQRYCGNGSLARCSRELWAALDAAGAKLAAAQGTTDPSKWRKSTKPELIQFSPVPLFEMQYTNKPSGIHQVMQFGG